MLPRLRIMTRRSLAFYVACFLLIALFVNMLMFQYQATRSKRYLQASNDVLRIVRQFSKMEESILPNQSTVILEPSSVATCRDSGKGLFILFIVTSAPKNVNSRQVIRTTFREMQSRWEEQFFLMKAKSEAHNLYVSRVFLLLFFVGHSAEDKLSEDKVREEWQRHGDVIVDNMKESYLRLTVKTLRMLKWALHNCADVKYLVKMDDDVFVNMPKLFSFLLHQPNGYNPLLIAGHTFEGAAPVRDPSSKWFTPVELWSRDHYPKYAAGFFYMLGLKVAQELFTESRNVPLFHMEDVFLIGIVGSDRLKHEVTNPGGIVNFFLWFYHLYSSNWPMRQLIIHQVSSEQFRCWSKETGLPVEKPWIDLYWPLFLTSCPL